MGEEQGKYIMPRREFLKTTGLAAVGGLLLLSGCSEDSREARGIEKRANPDNNRAGMTEYDGLFPSHEPIGQGVGAMPGRVVWAYDPACVHWTEGHWWEFGNFDAGRILAMMKHGIAILGGEENPAEGWNALFRYHNTVHGRGERGYLSGERIAVKINMNGAGWSGPNDSHTQNAVTNPVLLRALLLSLAEDAGVAATFITVYDTTRNIPDYMRKYCAEGSLQGIRMNDSNSCVPDKSSPLKWSKPISGETSYLPLCVTQADYLINLADLKGHSMNGITLTAKNHFGSFINSDRKAAPVAAGLHSYIHADSTGFYTPLVDLMGHYRLGEKTILYLLDGIIVSPSEGGNDKSGWG